MALKRFDFDESTWVGFGVGRSGFWVVRDKHAGDALGRHHRVHSRAELALAVEPLELLQGARQVLALEGAFVLVNPRVVEQSRRRGPLFRVHREHLRDQVFGFRRGVLPVLRVKLKHAAFDFVE